MAMLFWHFSSFAVIYLSVFYLCSGECFIYIKKTSGSFHSPNYPSKYGNNLTCVYLIENPTNRPTLLTFKDFHVENSDYCFKDYLEVTTEDFGSEDPFIRRYCGKTPPTSFLIPSGRFEVKFVSDSKNTDRGFLAEFNELVLLPTTTVVEDNKDLTTEVQSSDLPNGVKETTYLNNRLPVKTTEYPLKTNDFISKSSLNMEKNASILPKPHAVLDKTVDATTKEEKPTFKTGIYILSTVGFCLVAVVVLNGILKIRRRKRKLANMIASEYSRYASMHSRPKKNAEDNINIIYNPNYAIAKRKEPSVPCVITKIDTIDSSTPSILADEDKPPVLRADRVSIGSSNGEPIDYALEEGSNYVLSVTSKNSQVISNGTARSQSVSSSHSPRDYTDVNFEDESNLHSLDVNEDVFNGATLEIEEIKNED